MNKIKQTILIWFFNFLHVQLFLSLISLPILVAWGLPFSLMTLVGNLIFAPFLSLFLLLSTTIFFSELLHIPTTYTLYLLEKLYEFWIYFLGKGSTKWLYAIDRWGLVFCIGGAVAACVLLHHKQWGREKNSWKLFLPLLLAPFLYQQVRGLIPYQGTLTCSKRTAFLSSSRGKVSVVDHGALGEKKSAGTWVQYAFLAQVTRQCGSAQFDTITCSYPTERTIEALETLSRHAPINRIILTHPARQSKRYKEQYKKLEATTKKEGIVLIAKTIPQ